jgi:hypothetical protein
MSEADDLAQLAQFIRDKRSGDRLELLLRILARWPALRGAELQAAIDAATAPKDRRQTKVLRGKRGGCANS